MRKPSDEAHPSPAPAGRGTGEEVLRSLPALTLKVFDTVLHAFHTCMMKNPAKTNRKPVPFPLFTTPAPSPFHPAVG